MTKKGPKGGKVLAYQKSSFVKHRGKGEGLRGV